MMKNWTFFREDSGAVTVDWVVLTAGLVGLGLATMGVVSSGVEDISGDIEAELSRDNGTPIIRSAFSSPGPFAFDGESMTGITTYGEAGHSVVSSDTLGSVSGNNALVITNSALNDNGWMAGGIAIDYDEAIAEGDTFRVSYWARAETGEVQVTTFGYGSRGDGSGRGSDPESVSRTTVGTEWTYVEHEYTATQNDDKFYFASDDLGATFGLDDFKMERLN